MLKRIIFILRAYGNHYIADRIEEWFNAQRQRRRDEKASLLKAKRAKLRAKKDAAKQIRAEKERLRNSYANLIRREFNTATTFTANTTTPMNAFMRGVLEHQQHDSQYIFIKKSCDAHGVTVDYDELEKVYAFRKPIGDGRQAYKKVTESELNTGYLYDLCYQLGQIFEELNYTIKREREKFKNQPDEIRTQLGMEIKRPDYHNPFNH